MDTINVGRCKEMCPVEERRMREQQRILHPLEMLAGTERDRLPKADPKRTIKQYNRSAAGVDLTNPDRLRPPSVLYSTVEYLLTTVINTDRYSAPFVYDFITDRLRCISQDVVIQSLSPADCIKIYEPIVLFHTMSGYKLIEEPLKNFDPTLNKKQLLEYIKRLLICYDDSDSENRPVIESVYILLNIGDTNALNRFLTLPERIKRSSVVSLAFNMALNYNRGNYVRFCQSLPKLPAICMCAAVVHLPAIHKRALQIMSVAFHSKVLTYPLEHLKTELLYDDKLNLIEDCRQFKIKIIDDSIQFMKDDFVDSAAIKSRKISILDEKLKNVCTKSILLNS